jgi:hypothetical protein
MAFGGWIPLFLDFLKNHFAGKTGRCPELNVSRFSSNIIPARNEKNQM